MKRSKGQKMQLVQYDSSKLTYLFATGPRGIYYPSALESFLQRYGFVVYPTAVEAIAAENGIEFKHGVFDGKAIESLSIYSDGIVIVAKEHTSFHDALLEDIIAWLINQMGLSIIRNHASDRMYHSSIVFESKNDILAPALRFGSFQKRLSGMVEKNSNINVDFHAFGFNFSPDPHIIPGMKPPSFQVERWLMAEFSMNRFLSRAPVKSDQHIELIEMLQDLLGNLFR
jgi:hypothetical protein